MFVTNRNLIESGAEIFNNTGTYQYEGGFANRNVSTDYLLTRLGNDGDLDRTRRKKPVLVSDLLGAGKTFLMNKVKRDFEDNEYVRPIPITDDNVMEKYVEACKSSPPYVVLDEIDNKSELEDIIEILDELGEVNFHSDVQLVLLGDYVLQGTKLNGLLNIENADLVPMERLDQKFFREAMESRIGSVLSIDGYDAYTELFDADFLDLFLPNFEGPCATFRQTLKMLQDFTKVMPADDQIAKLDLGVFADFWSKLGGPAQRGLPAGLHQQYENFVEWTRSRLDVGGFNSSSGSTLEELAQALKVDFDDPDDFFDDYILPFMRKGYIRYLGIPYELGDEQDRHRYPQPYLPMPCILMDAACR